MIWKRIGQGIESLHQEILPLPTPQDSDTAEKSRLFSKFQSFAQFEASLFTGRPEWRCVDAGGHAGDAVRIQSQIPHEIGPNTFRGGEDVTGAGSVRKRFAALARTGALTWR